MRVLVQVACCLLFSASIALSADNPSEVETDAGGSAESEAADAAVEDASQDAPLVEDVFSEDGSVEETDSKSAKIDKFYNGLSSENITERVNGLYAQNVLFSSPFASITGREGLLEHYKTLFSQVSSFNLEISEEFVSGQETVLLWEATLTAKGLSGGEPIKVPGVTHLTFVNDQIVSQKDYFDAATMVYEHVTIVGRIVRWVKARVVGE